MHDTTLALVILSLFTSAEKAAEIEGDLLEQARSRGRIWFWWQLQLVCIALFIHALRSEAGKLLLYSYAIYELGLKLSWWVLLPFGYMLRSNFMPNAHHFHVRNAVLLPCAFVLGMLIMRLSPRHGGMLVLLAGGMVLGRVAILGSVAEVGRMLVFAMLPALAGALLMKWLELRSAGKVHASH